MRRGKQGSKEPTGGASAPPRANQAVALARPLPLHVVHPTPAAAELRQVLEVWRGRLAKTSQEGYAAHLAAFTRWLEATRGVTVGDTWQLVGYLVSQGRVGAEATVLEYLTGMLAAGKASSTVRVHRAAIRSAIAACEGLGLVPWRLTAALPRGVERTERRSTAGPTLAQLTAMLRVAAAQEYRLKALRDVAVLKLLVALRVRESEACRLRLRDYHDGTVRLVLKGHREGRDVAVPAPVRAAIDAYLAARGPLVASDPLFASCDLIKPGAPLTRSGLYQLVRALAKLADVPGAVSPHRLLHTASTALTDAGVSTDDLQAWGRWEKRETAENYIDSKQRVAERLAEELAALVEEETK